MFDANAGSEANEEVIGTVKVKALEQSIANNKLSSSDVSDVLDYFGYERIQDIRISDYMRVANELKKRSNQ